MLCLLCHEASPHVVVYIHVRVFSSALMVKSRVLLNVVHPAAPSHVEASEAYPRCVHHPRLQGTPTGRQVSTSATPPAHAMSCSSAVLFYTHTYYQDQSQLEFIHVHAHNITHSCLSTAGIGTTSMQQQTNTCLNCSYHGRHRVNVAHLNHSDVHFLTMEQFEDTQLCLVLAL